MNIEILKKLTRENRIDFKKHALLRMVEREITTDEIFEIIMRGAIIEEYLKDNPLPSCLISGYTSKNKPLHAVIAHDPEEQFLWVITAYSPDKQIWEDDFKKRRKI